MGYADLLAGLLPARRFGMRLGLERMEEALARLGNPERRMGAVVHVGGTNGKGSTAAFLEASLRAAGLRTGLYTSPHLSRFTERIRVAGVEVDGDELAARAVSAPFPELTFFEQTTLLALQTFAAHGTEVVVLEVGIGGRLDATNVVDAEVAVVTGVALDHTDILGGTLAAIATEKAGIFKPGRGAVIGASGEPEAVPWLTQAAAARGCRPVRVVSARDGDEDAQPLPPLGLAGPHQANNARAALLALDVLGEVTGGRLATPAPARAAGLGAARWPGRLERLDLPDGILWLDGAHNPAGARALADALPGLEPGVDRFWAVVAVSEDKDAAAILAALAPCLAGVIATRAPSPRAARAEVVAEAAAQAGLAFEIVPSFLDALGRARARAAGAPVLVTGTLFLVGAVRAAVTGEATDPVAVTDPAPVAAQL